MVDEYNFDLTQDERPVTAGAGLVGNIKGGLPTDASGAVRLTDPVTGAGLFTTNLDPNVVDYNPYTGGTVAVGMDVAFGAPMTRFFASKLINGNFQQGPPNPNAPISEDNPLPGWRYVVSSGDGFILRWVRVGNGNGQVNGEMRSGAAGDLTYLEQLAPAQPTTGPEWQYEVVPYATGTLNLIDAYAHVQFVDGTVTATGTAATSAGLTTGTPLYAGTLGQAPGDAERLRVRVGFQRNSGAAASATSASGVLSEVAVRESVDVARSWTPTLTAATPGDLSVVYSQRTGRYRVVGRMVLWTLSIITTTWTWTTASGAVIITGLPFTAATSSGHRWIGNAILRYTAAGFTQVASTVDSAENFIRLIASGTGVAPAGVGITNLPTGTQVTLYASGSYEF